MPNGSMLKFFQDRGGDDHGGPLHWPGTPEGFPFRGQQIPQLQGDEAYNIPLALDYKSDLFKLWEPEDKARFDQVMDRIVNGWYMQHRRKDIEVDGQILPAVWLEWVQIYGESPKGKVPGSGENGRTTTIPFSSTFGQRGG